MEIKNFLFLLPRILRRRRKIAMAVLLKTTGSVPQIPGAGALFSSGELLLGTLGGGMLEAAAAEAADRALKPKRGGPRLMEISLDAEISEPEAAVCGGSALVFIETSVQRDSAVFAEATRSLLDRTPGALLTWIGDQVRTIDPGVKSVGLNSVKRFWLSGPDLDRLPEPGLAVFKKGIRRIFLSGRPELLVSDASALSEIARGPYLFVEPLSPLPRLLIVGAGHVGQAVAGLGCLLDFELTVVDDRPEYANAVRFPDADRIIVDDIGRAVAGFSVAGDTYIVIVTRGHGHDADALRGCVRSNAAYIGMIGSRRKIELTRSEFLKNGWASAEEWNRIHAPIGLPIGSKTVAEIAVSIAAQLVEVRRKSLGNKNSVGERLDSGGARRT